MRHCHYWKKAGAKCAPSEIIVLDTETWHADRATVKGGEYHKLRLGCAIAYRLENNRRTRMKKLTFTDAAEFWRLVYSRLNKSRPVWLFCHNTPYDIGVVGGWKLITGSGLEVQKQAISGQLFYFKCIIKGCVLVIADTLNYYRCSLKQLGKAVGVPKHDMPKQEEPDSVWATYCMNDVEVTAAGIDSLIKFTRDQELGPWQISIAGLAFSGFRARFLQHKVLVHDYRKPLSLEREAYYGGLVETNYVGRVPTTPVYELDVCSMYPSVCLNPVPIHIRGYSERIGPEALERLARQHMIVAEVTVETDNYPYPVRLKDGTYYPLGRYTTSLPHPELTHALRSGHIKWVHRAAWYSHAPIFRDHMEHFAKMKIAYKAAGNEAYETLCKYYMNALYGKAGQMSPRWLEWGPEALELLEQKYQVPEGTLTSRYLKVPDLYELEEDVIVPELPEPIQVRDYYGVVEAKVGEHESRDSCPIIAATITSYARMLLRRYQSVAGSGHWFYSDTDSIWTDGTGYQNLLAAGCVRDKTLGQLEKKKEHEWLTIYGPKDYECPGIRRLKGIRSEVKPDKDGGFTQLHFPSAARQIKRGDTDGVFVASVTKHLSRELTRCVRLPGGFTRPLTFPQENPELQKERKVRRVARRN